jgi:hypothetical protein
MKKMKIVCAIDVGYENMGICRNSDGKIKTMIGSIHCTSDKRLFEYVEGNIPMLCREWLKTTVDYWRGSHLVSIERQHSKNWKFDRVCLLVQMSLESMLLVLYAENPLLFPKVITPSRAPVHWKRAVGVEIGGSDHDGNKVRGVEKFKEIFGMEEFKKFEQYDKVDDLCESALQTIWLLRDYDKLVGPMFYSDHVELHGQPGKPIKKEDRQVQLKPLISTKSDHDPIQLRRIYLEFKSRRKTKKETAKNTKIIKKLERFATPSKKRKIK